MEALSGDHLDVLLGNIPGLLHRLLGRHEVLLLVVHWVVSMGADVLHVLHGRSYKVVLHHFLDVHCRLGTVMLLILWEHEVVLRSELRCNVGLSLHDLLFLLDDLTFDILQTIFDQIGF